ncbi:MAG: diacylglycerol kinase [Nitrospirae bacterium RIFCSPLOW2_12_42_9]|nr:MAG: diacylglycerol kinase [Nitrospirae bacterium GWA2_42_11]OGW53838.1 MAG: diacylglycerol kinase [Nitrospirae bacterium RIFCSPLOWO2_02_42_7]OGW56936.1 MAG: diacylglycerol kinase [Nitrospirae bacterium RIFCSPLOW2_12_42_9]
MKPRNFIESANLAMEGILYAAKTQKHMRYHLWAAGAIILISLLLGVTRLEFLILSFIILLVLLSEIFNTAIEAIIDLVSPEFNPLAKIAKDVAAGAVFMVSLGAVVTGYLILYPYIKSPFTDIVIYIEVASEHLTLISVILVIIAVILTKAHSKTGRPFYGGLPSGHSAVSFSIGTSIAFLTKNALISILSFILAFMVASSRVSLGIHTTREIILGALLGTVITVLLFQIFG